MTCARLSIVDALKAGSEEFTVMRRLEMRFRGLFRGGSLETLDEWLRDAFSRGIYSMPRLAKTLRQDKSAVRNAVTDPWSNGQTEGQINRLKTLKRSMYGRADLNCFARGCYRFTIATCTESETDPAKMTSDNNYLIECGRRSTSRCVAEIRFDVI
jgi:transposase